jgi:hypothetical protein
MAWPTAAARTKTWGTEVLTASDLQGQFDLGFTYFNDSLNGSTGHGHTGGTNDGPKIPLTTSVTGTLPVANGGTGLASYAVGDVPYASGATTISKLSPSTAGQALSSAGATTAPVFAGMTTQGDVEYHNGTQRTALGAGTAGQVLKTNGAGSNPSFANSLGSVSDYSTSSSSSTAKQGTALKVCFGTTTSLSNGGTFTITNLPFTSSSSYYVVCSPVTNTTVQSAYATNSSGSQCVLTSMAVPAGSNVSCAYNWIAIGT